MAQQSGLRNNQGPSTLGIEKGTVKYETSSLKLELLKSSQTVYSLKTSEDNSYDFTPGNLLSKRDKNGYYHLGDLNFRVKTGINGEWKSFSTALNRADVDEVNTGEPNTLLASDLSKTLPSDVPLKIIRCWQKEGNDIILRFDIQNKTEQPVEIGALGIPMIFNNNHSNKSIDKAHEENVFFDPYIGMDAGFIQVVRLNGNGKVLVVIPYGKTPFEAYRPLLDDPTRPGITFEGFHEWMIHSKNYADTEWKGVNQWNVPTSQNLNPGEKLSYGLRFIIANSVTEIENSLLEAKRPVAVGIPGYVLPMDVEAKLFIKYLKKIKSISVEPENSLNVLEIKPINGWKTYVIKGQKWGRSRLTVVYEDDVRQTINYKVISTETEVVASYGKFSTNEQWFDDKNDPFNRAPSVISYDYEKKMKVTDDNRVWIAGLSDEGGAGGWLGAIMKQVVLPEKEEVAKLEDFVNNTIWGGIQFNEGDNKYGVRKSMYFYEPENMPEGTYSSNVNYKVWSAWNRKGAEDIGRSYNYPHVAAAYWAMYRISRYYKGLATQKSWNWYLENAFHTSIAMVEKAPHYARFGQMEGTIFIMILNELKKEGLTSMAVQLEKVMKKRVDLWSSMQFPFESEMPWDSTGQEEVYMWSKYFGFDEKATVTLKAILAYMPTLPHWAYNGNARRYWDFQYGGKIQRIERQIHHYGSGLNAIPVLHQYSETPEDFYLLRVGYGGLMGSISNITKDGFAPCAFHSYPSTLEIDGLSGDYGSGFFGYAVNTATYVALSNEFGWVSFGGNCILEGNWVNIELTTAAKSKVFIAPAKTWLTLDAGKFKSLSYNTKTSDIRLVFEKANQFTPEAYLKITSFSKNNTPSHYKTTLAKNEYGSYVVLLSEKQTKTELKFISK